MNVRGTRGCTRFLRARKKSGFRRCARPRDQQQPDENAFGIAEVYAFRGQTDEAMHWLERAYAQKDAYLYSVKRDPLLKNLKSDPRYKAFLRKMNLPE